MSTNHPLPKWHIVIMAGGVQPKFWGADETKHLVKVLGEPILKRTIRLLLEGCDYEITVITPSKRLEQYSRALIQAPRVRYVERPLVNEHKIYGALDVTLEKDLIILWGDVFFSRNSITRVLNDVCTESLEVYCRYGHSELTLKPWGEPFALRVQEASREKLYESTVWVNNAYEKGEIWRGSEWEVFKKYAEFENFDGYRAHPKLPFYREINDFTEDVDSPEDYEKMLQTLPSNLEDALDLISKLRSNSVVQLETLEQEKQTLEQEKQTLEQEKQILEQEKQTLEQEKQTLEQEKQTLEQEKQTLEQEKQTLEQEKQTIQTVLIQTFNSRSWRLTKPLRSLFMSMRTRF